MISKPVLTKEIKLNKQVYDLELWGPTNSNTYDPIRFSPDFQKDFFNEVDMHPTWGSKQRVDAHQEQFSDWFDKLSTRDQRKYAKAIDESNRVIITIVWDLILPQDKTALFNNNLQSFSRWFSALDIRGVDHYMSRIMNKQRLMPDEFTPHNDTILESDIANILEDMYDGINDDLIRATSINGLLCISCSSESRLQKAKQHMIRHGSILRDYRKKQNSSGRVIYTYIFSKP